MKQRLLWIAWPSFLMAAVLEVLVFGLVDPQELQWFGGPLELSRQSVYTAGFFLFWAVTAITAALTTLLSMSPFEVNRCPMPVCDRPEICAIKSPHS